MGLGSTRYPKRRAIVANSIGHQGGLGRQKVKIRLSLELKRYSRLSGGQMLDLASEALCGPKERINMRNLLSEMENRVEQL